MTLFWTVSPAPQARASTARRLAVPDRNILQRSWPANCRRGLHRYLLDDFDRGHAPAAENTWACSASAAGIDRDNDLGRIADLVTQCEERGELVGLLTISTSRSAVEADHEHPRPYLDFASVTKHSDLVVRSQISER
jgi:hypothetical protein